MLFLRFGVQNVVNYEHAGIDIHFFIVLFMVGYMNRFTMFSSKDFNLVNSVCHCQIYKGSPH